MDADAYLAEKDSDAYRDFHMRQMGTLEQEYVSREIVDGHVVTVTRTVPGINIPWALRRAILGNKRAEFIDRRTWPEGAHRTAPFTQSFRTTNNITDRCVVEGEIAIEPAGPPGVCRVRARGECVVTLRGFGPKIEQIIVDNLRASYEKLPGVLEAWLEHKMNERETTRLRLEPAAAAEDPADADAKSPRRGHHQMSPFAETSDETLLLGVVQGKTPPGSPPRSRRARRDSDGARLRGGTRRDPRENPTPRPAPGGGGLLESISVPKDDDPAATRVARRARRRARGSAGPSSRRQKTAPGKRSREMIDTLGGYPGVFFLLLLAASSLYAYANIPAAELSSFPAAAFGSSPTSGGFFADASGASSSSRRSSDAAIAEAEASAMLGAVEAAREIESGRDDAIERARARAAEARRRREEGAAAAAARRGGGGRKARAGGGGPARRGDVTIGRVHDGSDACVDARKGECEAWACSGECEANPGFMLEACACACAEAAREAAARARVSASADFAASSASLLADAVTFVARWTDPGSGSSRTARFTVDLDAADAPAAVAAVRATLAAGTCAPGASGACASGCRFTRAERAFGLVQGKLAGLGRAGGAFGRRSEGRRSWTRGTVGYIPGGDDVLIALGDHPEWDPAFTAMGAIRDEAGARAAEAVAGLPTEPFRHPTYGTVMAMLTSEVRFSLEAANATTEGVGVGVEGRGES